MFRPWKIHGTRLTHAHVFNMRDFEQLQEMFDIILELLDKEDSNGDPVFDCVSHNHVATMLQWVT